MPFSPGGGTDTYARIFKQAIEQESLLSQPLVVINQGGAGGTIGSRRVKDAAPDGYTMMVLHDAILTAKIAGQAEYGHEAFEPIAATSEVGMVIAVRKDSPFTTLDELMRAARDRPDSIRFGANNGALTHFAGLQLEALAPGAEFRYAQIGGGAERYANLTAGHIELTGFSIEEFVRFRGDQLRGLCYFGEQRHPAATDVPTAKEQGYPLVSRNTFYWWFPKGVPRDRVRYMEEVLRKAVSSPLVVDKLTEIHCQPIFLKGRPLLQRLNESQAEFTRVQAEVVDPLPWLPWLLLGACTICAAGAGVEGFRLAWRRAERDNPETVIEAKAANVGRWRAAATFAALVVYVAALQVGLDFRFVTFAFAAGLGALLSTPSWKAWTISAACGLLIAVGVYYLFTEFFVVDLPAAG